MFAWSLLAARSQAALEAADAVGDDRATAIVYVVVGILAAIGIALVVLAVWIWRVTKPDRVLLAPLELMDDPAWRRQDPQGRRRALDDVRPEGAVPLTPAVRQPSIDEEFDADQPVADFDDLAEPIDDPLVIELDDGSDDDWNEDVEETTAIAVPVDSPTEPEPEPEDDDAGGEDDEALEVDWDETSDPASPS